MGAEGEAMDKELREGSARKRGAIIAAGRELFLTEGFDHATMNEIAAQAGVSKRMVYDYYGDKRTLFNAVLEQVVLALRAAIQTAIDTHLDHGDDLENSLIGFARSITVTALDSSDYTTLNRLLSLETDPDRDAHSQWADAEPEIALAAHFAKLNSAGLLSTPNPRRAADHFAALALGPTVRRSREPLQTDTERDEALVDGVRAFLRAYRRAETPGGPRH